MEDLVSLYDRVDRRITHWMARHGIRVLRVSLGVVFFWFGFLKFYAGLSPAEEIAIRTIGFLTFDLIPATASIRILAAWECAIGLGLLTGRFLRATLFLLFLQMCGTVTPLFLFPYDLFVLTPLVPTLEGQYIIKNLVLVSAGLVIGSTVRGGSVVAEAE